MLSRWKVAPVITIGEVKYPVEIIPQKEKYIGKYSVGSQSGFVTKFM